MNKKIASFFKNPENIIIAIMIGLILFSILLILGARAGGLGRLFSSNSNSSSSISSVVIESQSPESASSIESSSSEQSSSVGFIGKFVKTVPNGSDAGEGLNWRDAPCGNLNGDPKRWGNVGTIIGEPERAECAGEEYDFYQIAWEDGTSGWSAGDFLEISDTKPELEIGTISGVVGYPSEAVPAHVVCAKDIQTKKDYCTSQRDTLSGNFDQSKLEYTIEVPIGTYYVFMDLTDGAGDLDIAYFTECTFEGSSIQGEEKQNKCLSDEPVNAVKVFVTNGENVVDINPFDWGRVNVVLR